MDHGTSFVNVFRPGMMKGERQFRLQSHLPILTHCTRRAMECENNPHHIRMIGLSLPGSLERPNFTAPQLHHRTSRELLTCSVHVRPTIHRNLVSNNAHMSGSSLKMRTGGEYSKKWTKKGNQDKLCLSFQLKDTRILKSIGNGGTMICRFS